MMKNNLLQSKPKVYEKKSTEKEVYETQSCQLLRVRDSANALEKISNETGEEIDSVVENLYDAMNNFQLNKRVRETIDSKQYDVSVSISDYQQSRTATVKINKRSVRAKIQNGIKNFLTELVGQEILKIYAVI